MSGSMYKSFDVLFWCIFLYPVSQIQHMMTFGLVDAVRDRSGNVFFTVMLK
jgi:hypothetical protein